MKKIKIKKNPTPVIFVFFSFSAMRSGTLVYKLVACFCSTGFSLLVFAQNLRYGKKFIDTRVRNYVPMGREKQASTKRYTEDDLENNRKFV